MKKIKNKVDFHTLKEKFIHDLKLNSSKKFYRFWHVTGDNLCDIWNIRKYDLNGIKTDVNITIPTAICFNENPDYSIDLLNEMIDKVKILLNK